MLHEARHRGLLTPASMPGHRGLASLTERGNAVLAAAKTVPANVPAATQNRPHSSQRQPKTNTKTRR